MTKYLVLRASEESGAEEDGAPAGTYVATPARSWKPLVVKPERTFTFS